MRLRFPERLEAKGLTLCHLAKRSNVRIGLSTALRYARMKGRVAIIDGEVLEACGDVLEVTPGELLEREAPRRRRGR